MTAIGLDLYTLTFWEIKAFSTKPPKCETFCRGYSMNLVLQLHVADRSRPGRVFETGCGRSRKRATGPAAPESCQRHVGTFRRPKNSSKHLGGSSVLGARWFKGTPRTSFRGLPKQNTHTHNMWVLMKRSGKHRVTIGKPPQKDTAFTTWEKLLMVILGPNGILINPPFGCVLFQSRPLTPCVPGLYTFWEEHFRGFQF